jgi:Protein of unknown function (DUF4058)
MPVHNWTRVEAGIFHHFYHGWIEEIARSLNRGVLPSDYYALAEQFAAGLGPDVLTLHAPQPRGNGETDHEARRCSDDAGGGVLLAPPKARPIAETDMEFYRRKQTVVAVRHVSGDRVVAVVEVVSPGNKSTHHALQQFVRKVADFLEKGVHMLILDRLPPGRHDPQGIHGAIWYYLTEQADSAPIAKPLTLAAYESDLAVRAYVENVGVGDVLPDMHLFLEPRGCIDVPLEASYQAAWDAVPRRWKDVIEARR